MSMNTQEIDVRLENAAPVEADLSVPELIKGEKGDTPVKGVDYFTPEDIEELKQELEIPDLTPYALKEELPQAVSELTNDAGYLTEETEPKFTAAEPQLALKSEIDGLASKNYVDGKIPTKTSDLTNDSGFLTEHQSLDEYAKKANLATVATSGSYNDLIDKPDISGGASAASEVSFDDTTAQIGKTNVQEAIEYLVDEAVDSTSVQEQIDTTLKTTTDYGGRRGAFGIPASYINYIREMTMADPELRDFLDYCESVAVRDIKDTQMSVRNNNRALYWNTDTKVFTKYSPIKHNVRVMKGHYYMVLRNKNMEYYREHGIDLDNNLQSCWTDIENPLATIPEAVVYTFERYDYTYIVYDVTPYFQIVQHEKDIAALKENSGAAPDLTDYYTKEEVDAKGYLTEHQDISNLATKAEIPTAVSQLTNDKGYLTQHQDISGKADKSALAAVATSGSYNDLSDKPIIPSTAGLASEEWVEAKGYLTEHQSLNAYAKKTDLPTKVSDLTNDAGFITTHQSLEGYAKTTEVNNAISAHNTGADAHSDIRDLIDGLTTRLNTLADSDDTTLDQLSEIVAYIKANRELIEGVTTDKVNVSDIIDNLITNAANKPLSAKQGAALKSLIDAIVVPTKVSELQNDSGYLTQHQSLADYAKKTEIPTKVSELTNDKNYLTEHQSLAAYAKTADLASIATSGSYADLTGKPTIPAKVSDLTNDTGFITAADVAQEIFIATYGETTIEEIAAAVDAGKMIYCRKGAGIGQITSYNNTMPQFLINNMNGSYILVAVMQGQWVKVKTYTSLPQVTTSNNDKIMKVVNGAWALSDLPTNVSEFTNDAGYLTAHQSLAEYAKKTEIPTAVSQLTNDKGYLTEHQDVSGLVPKARKINGKSLTADIALTAADVGATTKDYVDSLQPVAVEGTLTAGSTSIELTNAAITTDKTFDFYTSSFGVNPKSAVVATGKITLTFEAQETDLQVKVEVK